jgi:hypothetical protein
MYVNILSPGSTVKVERSTFRDNSAQQDGGAIYALSQGLELFNSTLFGNRADYNGGGVYASANVIIKNSTITANTANATNTTTTGNGGGVYGNATLTLTAVGGNIDVSGGPEYRPDCSGSIVSTGFSAIGIWNGCSATWDNGPANQHGTTPLPLDLGLLALADNGGASPTVALGLDSPLLDAGTQVCAGQSSDQRDSSRVKQDGNNDGGFDNDPCDIGAFETFKRGCSLALPITLTEFTYTDTQDVKSKALLSTVGNVSVASSGDLILVSSTGISLGGGFWVADLGRFQADIRTVSCP